GLESRYNDAQWKGRFTDLNIHINEVPPLQLASSEWINASAERGEVGQQCLTTRSFRDWRRRSASPEDTGAAADPNRADSDVVIENNNESEAPDDQADEAPARLCINGVWD